MGNPTYTPATEFWKAGGFMVSEANGHRSRDQVTLTGAVAIKAGTVLGKKTTGASATSAALGTNVGNGTFGTVTLVTTATQPGVYSLVYTSATAFTVTAPDGTTATGSNGNAFSALGIGFTMTTGATPMVAGDGFTITITSAIGKPTAASVANGGNTGNSTSSAVTTTGYAPIPGIYRVNFARAVTDLGSFTVVDPTGQNIGHGVVGTAFVGGGLTFTIADGSTDFVPSDQFIVTVVAGAGTYAPLSLSDVTGLNVAAAIAWDYTDVTLADKTGTAIVRSCEVNKAELVWPTGMNAASKVTALAQLATAGIIGR